LGIPFDVRLDGVRARSCDCSGAVVDLANLMEFLGTPARRVYWQPQVRPDPEQVRVRLGDERARTFLTALAMPGICPDWYAAVLCDDILDNHPSLIIRGREFSNPVRWMADTVASPSMMCHTSFEDVLYAAAGREKQELQLPLITSGGYKLSKSSGNVPHWSVLAMVDRYTARGFLDSLGDQTAEWSWKTWASWVQGA
jgi:hypothetical protein